MTIIAVMIVNIIIIVVIICKEKESVSSQKIAQHPLLLPGHGRGHHPPPPLGDRTHLKTISSWGFSFQLILLNLIKHYLFEYFRHTGLVKN